MTGSPRPVHVGSREISLANSGFCSISHCCNAIAGAGGWPFPPFRDECRSAPAATDRRDRCPTAASSTSSSVYSVTFGHLLSRWGDLRCRKTMSTTLHRVLLTVLAFTAAFTGGWAYVAPRSWYESFPGFGLSRSEEH